MAFPFAWTRPRHAARHEPPFIGKISRPGESRSLNPTRRFLASHTSAGHGIEPTGYIPFWVAKEIASLPTPAGYIYVRNASAGSGDGSSWANATTLNSVNTLITQAAAGNKQILVRADEGAHTPTTGQIISSAGVSRDNPVVIRGVNADLSDAVATITGNRAAVFAPGATDGSSFLRLNATAAYITLSRLNFVAWGNGVLQLNASGASNIGMLDCTGSNLYRCIETNASVSASRITVKRFTGVGFERSFSRFRGDTHDCYVQGVNVDGGGHIDDLFQVGFSLEDTAHFVIYSGCTASNWRYSPLTDPALYWNGDGFSTERTNYGVACFSCTANGCTDGGFDFKSTETYLFDPVSFDNKNNYRLWGDAICVRPISRDPFKRGGSGVQCHFDIAQFNTPNLRIIGAICSDTDPTTKMYYVETGSALLYSAIAGSMAGDFVQYDGVSPLGTITLIPAPGTAPVITSPSLQTVAENIPVSIALTATGSPAYWAITGGSDYGQFVFDNGWFMSRTPTALTMAAQDFETPLDSDANNSYLVQLTAYGQGLASRTQNISVAITDVVYEGPDVYDGDYFEKNLGQADYTYVVSNPRGAWATAIGFAAGDVVTQAGLTYYCLTAHTSGTFATDLNNKKWDPAGSTRYTLNAALDSALFTMTFNTLLLPAQNYASPADVDHDNIYVASILATTLATGAAVTITQQARVVPVVLTAGTAYVGPAPAGLGDGSSVANRAAVTSQLNAMVQAVGPGGTVNLVSDVGTYVGNFGTLTKGGSPGHPVTLRGIDSSGNPMAVPVSGTRTTFTPPVDPQTPTNALGWNGNTMVSLGFGANHLKFDNWTPQNLGVFITCVGDCHDIVLRRITAFNFQRFFEVAHNIAIGDVDMDSTVTVSGYSKQCVRMRGGSHHFRLTGVVFDSMRQNNDNFSVGCGMEEFAHDRYLTNCTMKNHYDDTEGTGFWNADGASSENTNWNDFIDGGEYSGNTDAGLDLKGALGAPIGATTAVLLKDNRANLKVWYGTKVIANIDSRDPHSRGGSGHPDHIDGDGSAALIGTNYTTEQIIFVGAACKFTDTNAACAIYHGESSGTSYSASTHVRYHVAPGVTETSAGSRTFTTGVQLTIDNFTATPPYELIGQTTPTTVASGNLAFTEPTLLAAAAGDLMIIEIDHRDTPLFTLDAFWTVLAYEKLGNILTNASAISSGLVAVGIRGASAPNMTCTRTAGGKANGALSIYRKLDGTAWSMSDIVVRSVTQPAATTTPTLNSITTVAPNSLIRVMVGSPRDSGCSALNATDPGTVSGAISVWDYPYPGKWFQRTNVANTGAQTCSCGGFDAVKATAGATGNFSATALLCRQVMIAIAIH